MEGIEKYKAKIAENAAKYVSTLPTAITHQQIESKYGQTKAKLESLLFSYPYIKQELKVSSTVYYNVHGIARRKANCNTLPFYVVQYYIEDMGARINKSQLFTAIYNNVLHCKGIGGETVVYDRLIRNAMQIAIQELVNIDPPYRFSCKNTKRAFRTMIGAFTESLLLSIPQFSQLIDQLNAITQKLGMCLRMLHENMPENKITFNVINPSAQLVLSVQKVSNSEYWVLYTRNDIRDLCWYDTIKPVLKIEKKKEIYQNYKFKVEKYADVLNDFGDKFGGFYSLICKLCEFYKTKNIHDVEILGIKNIIENIDNHDMDKASMKDKIRAIEQIETSGVFSILSTINRMSSLLSNRTANDTFDNKSYKEFLTSNTFEQLQVNANKYNRKEKEEKDININTMVKCQEKAKFLDDRINSEIQYMELLNSTDYDMLMYIEFMSCLSFKLYSINDITNMLRALSPSIIKEVIIQLTEIAQVQNKNLTQAKINIIAFITRIIAIIPKSRQDIAELLSVDMNNLNELFLIENSDSESMSRMKKIIIQEYASYANTLINALQSKSAISTARYQTAKDIYQQIQKQILLTFKRKVETCRLRVQLQDDTDTQERVENTNQLIKQFVSTMFHSHNILIVEIQDDLYEHLIKEVNEEDANSLICLIMFDEAITNKADIINPIAEYLISKTINMDTLYSKMIEQSKYRAKKPLASNK